MFLAILNAERGATLSNGSNRITCGVHPTREAAGLAIDRAIIEQLACGRSPGRPDVVQIIGHSARPSLRCRI